MERDCVSIGPFRIPSAWEDLNLTTLFQKASQSWIQRQARLSLQITSYCIQSQRILSIPFCHPTTIALLHLHWINLAQTSFSSNSNLDSNLDSNSDSSNLKSLFLPPSNWESIASLPWIPCSAIHHSNCTNSISTNIHLVSS